MRISDWSSDVCSSDLVKIVRYRRESEMTANSGISDQALAIAAKVEAFVRKTVIPYEKDPRRDHHGAPTDELVMEMREHARAAGVLTPPILSDGSHLKQPATAVVPIPIGNEPRRA